jgi:hypothetical protein
MSGTAWRWSRAMTVQKPRRNPRTKRCCRTGIIVWQKNGVSAFFQFLTCSLLPLWRYKQACGLAFCLHSIELPGPIFKIPLFLSSSDLLARLWATAGTERLQEVKHCGKGLKLLFGLHSELRCQDCWVSVLTGLQLEHQSSIPDKAAYFSSRRQAGPGTHPASYRLASFFSSQTKLPGLEVKHSPASSAEVKECVELYPTFPYCIQDFYLWLA